MLKRVAAHWLVVGPGHLIPCAGVALDEEGAVREIFSLADSLYEPAGTTFVDGFVAPFRADASAVHPDGLKQFLQDCSAKQTVELRIGETAKLFNYFVSEDGAVVVTSLSDLFTNIKTYK